jgi:penicillin amidase
MVVSLERDGVKAWGTYPGGQSGNPGSKYYNNLLERWIVGEYYPLQFMKDVSAPEQGFVTTFTPN